MSLPPRASIHHPLQYQFSSPHYDTGYCLDDEDCDVVDDEDILSITSSASYYDSYPAYKNGQQQPADDDSVLYGIAIDSIASSPSRRPSLCSVLSFEVSTQAAVTAAAVSNKDDLGLNLYSYYFDDGAESCYTTGSQGNNMLASCNASVSSSCSHYFLQNQPQPPRPTYYYDSSSLENPALVAAVDAAESRTDNETNNKENQITTNTKTPTNSDRDRAQARDQIKSSSCSAAPVIRTPGPLEALCSDTPSMIPATSATLFGTASSSKTMASSQSQSHGSLKKLKATTPVYHSQRLRSWEDSLVSRSILTPARDEFQPQCHKKRSSPSVLEGSIIVISSSSSPSSSAASRHSSNFYGKAQGEEKDHYENDEEDVDNYALSYHEEETIRSVAVDLYHKFLLEDRWSARMPTEEAAGVLGLRAQAEEQKEDLESVDQQANPTPEGEASAGIAKSDCMMTTWHNSIRKDQNSLPSLSETLTFKHDHHQHMLGQLQQITSSTSTTCGFSWLKHYEQQTNSGWWMVPEVYEDCIARAFDGMRKFVLSSE